MVLQALTFQFGRQTAVEHDALFILEHRLEAEIGLTARDRHGLMIAREAAVASYHGAS